MIRNLLAVLISTSFLLSINAQTDSGGKNQGEFRLTEIAEEIGPEGFFQIHFGNLGQIVANVAA